MTSTSGPLPRLLAHLSPVVAALVLAACASAPDYHAPSPAPELPAQFSGARAGAGTASNSAAQDLAHFWHGFGDPTLDDLVKSALDANGDLKLAEARLREARSSLDLAAVQNLPTFGVNGDVQRAVAPIYQSPGTTREQRTYTAYDAGFLANWELDLFGRASSAKASALASAEASTASVQAAQVSVVAEVARNYLELRGTQERLQVTQRALDNQKESLSIVQARHDAGRATDLDLEQALSLVQSTQAQLPALATVVDQTILRLATLTGASPPVLLQRLRAPAPLPGLPTTDLASLPLGTPQQWLARRPDLRAAERQLAAANADIGVARADLYPHITLSGLLGLSSSSLSTFGQSDSQRYSIGPSVTWNAFDFGRVRAQIAGSEARKQEAFETWQQAVRLALEETEGAFTQFSHGNERSSALGQAADHAEAAAGLARVRYEAGVTDFLAVLDAERSALSARDQWTQARTDTAAALVAVYRTLGGGWEVPQAN